MLKQRWLHRKQNPLSWALASLTWLYIYWAHTFPKSNCSLHRKLCPVVALLLKGYFTFTCRLFLTFQRFILKFSKTVQSPGVPDFGVLGPGSRVPGPYFRLCRKSPSFLKKTFVEVIGVTSFMVLSNFKSYWKEEFRFGHLEISITSASVFKYKNFFLHNINLIES